MLNESVDAKKFCKIPHVDIENIYLGPSTKLTHCSCPPPPLYPEKEPFDEEYLNDSRYISEKDRKLYEQEFEEILKKNDYRKIKFLIFHSIFIAKNFFEKE